uniref:AAA+ ATPase domain-containing protein n=1 Tax=Romanomermis culicivorax TaxID=13658 RepID=A0A915IYN9_ROMCU
MDDSVDIRQVIFYIVRLAASTVAGIYLVNKLIGYLDPTNAQKKKSKLVAEQILKHVGINAKDISELTDYEMMIATHVISSDTGVTWNDVGGYASEINELQDNIILPLRLSCSSKVFSPPKGVLLYGPPGCGKTLIAKALASAAESCVTVTVYVGRILCALGARFINLQISTLTDKWYGESNKLASAVFSLARKLQPSIIFIDEIDSFLRSRASDDHEATAMMKALFMSLWEGFSTDAHNRIIILGATNRPQDVDAAILRRMPTKYYIGLPDEYQRRLIFQVILKNELVILLLTWQATA